MLRTNRRIIETSRDGMRRCNLAFRVLKYVSHRSLQPPRTSTAVRVEARRVLAQPVSRATSFDADHLHVRVAETRMKQPDRVRATADTRDQRIRQTAFAFENLRARLASDHALKVAHHQRVRMWSKRAAEQGERGGDIP